MKWEKIIKRNCGCGKDPCETYGEVKKGKGERHFYIKDGKPVQWIGETHKHPDGTLMSGKEHKEGVSKKLLHFYQLDEKHLKHLSKETTAIKSYSNEEIEKFFGRNKQPQQLTKDGVNFTDQRALDMYNQNISKYPTIKNALRGKTVNTSAIETAVDNAARMQRQKQSFQNSPKRSPSPRMPTESDFRRPAY